MGIQEKQKTIVMAQIFAGLAFGKAIIELLRRKFKQIPSGYLEKIKSQDLSTLERITEDIFDIEKPEDLDRYLS